MCLVKIIKSLPYFSGIFKLFDKIIYPFLS